MDGSEIKLHVIHSLHIRPSSPLPATSTHTIID